MDKYAVVVRGLDDESVWHVDATHHDHPELEYRLKMTALDQQLRLTSVEVLCEADGVHEVQTADLRTLRLNALVVQARAAVLEAARSIATDAAAPQRTRSMVGQTLSARAPRAGRPSLPDAHYERIARRYLELLADGTTRGILHRLSEEEGRPVETVRTWVNVARSERLQYLTPGTPGRAGALPGPGLPPISKPQRTRGKR